MIRVFRRTKTKQMIHAKLLRRWSGPYVVETVPGEKYKNCYIVCSPNGEEKILVNVKNIKRYHERPEWMNVEQPWEDVFLDEERGQIHDEMDEEEMTGEKSMEPVQTPGSEERNEDREEPVQMTPNQVQERNTTNVVNPPHTGMLIDAAIKQTGQMNWYCGRVIAVDQGKKKLRFKALSGRVGERWVPMRRTRICNHKPQSSGPTEGFILTINEQQVTDMNL
jgi:hypothetical protein